MGLITWVVLDAIRGRVYISGACIGPIVGLVAITPACGFVQPGWALLMAIIATCIVYGLLLLKKYMRFDDTLDVAIVHGCGMRILLIFFTLSLKKYIVLVFRRRYSRCIHDWTVLSEISQRKRWCRWSVLRTSNSTVVSDCRNSHSYR
jgi:ammonia channel protein AmtB